MKLKYKIFLSFCFAIFTLVKGQNLVPNPSFEYTVSCPTSINQLNKCQSWINPTNASPDYFNACSTANGNAVHVPNNGFGTQSANTGVAYAGFYGYNTSSREYIQTSLSNTLTTNHKYLVSFYVSLADGMQYAISSVGAYFSSNQISNSTTHVLPYIPQIQNKSSNSLSDKNNWMLITDTLYANGNEQFVTIGNFNPDSTSDTLFLGNIGGGNFAYYFIDDVSVIDYGIYTGINKKNEVSLQVNIYPNPAKDIICIGSKEAVEIKLFDLLGNKVLTTKEKNINTEDLQNGIYIIKVTSLEGKFFQQKLIISH